MNSNIKTKLENEKRETVCFQLKYFKLGRKLHNFLDDLIFSIDAVFQALELKSVGVIDYKTTMLLFPQDTRCSFFLNYLSLNIATRA